jgi:hypothetical protein
VFQIGVLRRIFGIMRQESPRGLDRLMNEELQNSYFLPKIFRVIISRGMR